jgi:hypothetical protein
MNKYEQIDAFHYDLTNLINRYKAEFDIDLHTIVGVLEDKKISMLLGEDLVDFSADDDLLEEEDE